MLKWLLPYIPKSLIWQFASTYIAGETMEQCIAKGSTINADGHKLAIDLLGEHTKTKADSDAVVATYRELIRKCSEASLDFGVSLKLSHLGADTDRGMGVAALKSIAAEAKAFNTRVTLDMESSKMTDLTLGIYNDNLETCDLGMVLQAYLRRSFEDAKALVNAHDPEKLHIRVCKGIYKEPNNLLVGDRSAINANYITLAEYLYDQGAYVCIATHDPTLIDYFSTLNWNPWRFEFQVLLGVPVRDRMDALRDQGFKTTVYLPYGPDWYAYSIRRLLENPALIRYVLKNMLG